MSQLVSRPAWRLVSRFVVRPAVVLFLVSVAVFGATELLPSDAAQARSGGRASAGQEAALRAELGLDRPAWERYASWAGGLPRGDAGRSLVTDRPVSAVVAERLPATLALAGCALAVAVPLLLVLAWAAGTAAHAGSRAAGPLGGLITGAAAVPQIVFAAALAVAFAGPLRLLPPVSLLPATGSPLDAPEILVLPALALAVPAAAYGAVLLGGGVADVLRRPHVTAAVARGVPRARVALRHVLPHLAAPAARVVALVAGGLLASTAVVETVFGYAGLGELLVGAVGTRDTPVVQAVAMLAAVAVLGGLLLADALAALTRTGDAR
ncbi:ABC transporter permease [Actinomadura sp. WMMB 499]|uniref:ABC transporter permease n=1 Tax=Actinomadura sp. WMMB 499 TaxID=1219491 RepID=UPI0020C78D9F|nr:ABC transporter permease [Actinomadura sp. WMMB 499]